MDTKLHSRNRLPCTKHRERPCLRWKTHLEWVWMLWRVESPPPLLCEVSIPPDPGAAPNLLTKWSNAVIANGLPAYTALPPLAQRRGKNLAVIPAALGHETQNMGTPVLFLATGTSEPGASAGVVGAGNLHALE
jgi:hypothetical protein